MPMDNYPDDIENYVCKICRELTPNCVCGEYAKEALLNTILNDDDDDTYFNMFDSSDSDEVVKLLRDLHRNPSEKVVKLLVNQLEDMLAAYVADID